MSAGVTTQYAIRWAESLPDCDDISQVFETRELAEESLAATSYGGTIVDRQVITTDWVPS